MADMGGLAPGRGPTFDQYAGAVRRAIELNNQFVAELQPSEAGSISWKTELITSVGKVELTLRHDEESGLDRVRVFFSPPPPSFNEAIANTQGVTISRRIAQSPDDGSMAFVMLGGQHRLDGIRLAPGEQIHILALEVASSMLAKTAFNSGTEKEQARFKSLKSKILEDAPPGAQGQDVSGNC